MPVLAPSGENRQTRTTSLKVAPMLYFAIE